MFKYSVLSMCKVTHDAKGKEFARALNTMKYIKVTAQTPEQAANEALTRGAYQVLKVYRLSSAEEWVQC